MKLAIWIYVLVNKAGERAYTTVNDPGDKICIGIRDEYGAYQQFDSYEAWYLEEWARQRGLYCDSREVSVEVPKGLLP